MANNSNKSNDGKGAVTSAIFEGLSKFILVSCICVIFFLFSIAFIVETYQDPDRNLEIEHGVVLASLGGSVAVQYYFGKKKKSR